jgi:hypothetical protein
MSDTVGVIVDGDGDFAALRKRFTNGFRIVKTDGPRGHTADSKEIVRRARKQIRILRGLRCKRVVVVLDFEERGQPYQTFVDHLRAEFSCTDLGVPVGVAVPNRMIENWYLADIEHLSANKVFLKRNLRQRNYEGCHGKSQMKKFMRRPHTYSETKHGPEMFAILRFPVARTHSSSFDAFLALMPPS